MQALTKTETTAPTARPSALALMASRLSVDPTKLLESLKATVFRGATNEDLLSLVAISNEYQLNPFLREIYAFPAKGGGVTPIISFDGWVKIVSRHPLYDGVEFSWTFDGDGKPESCTCTMHVKGRSKPVTVTEWLAECARNTDIWRSMPRRMLRHKSFIQAARLAFGITGAEEDEASRDNPLPVTVEVASEPEPTAPPTRSPIPTVTPQAQLCDLVESSGCTFDDLVAWGETTGNIKDATSFPDWDAIPTDIAKRLLRNKSGLIESLRKLKGQSNE